ncbi:protein PELOTA 1-like [Argentina anserina]|uniref:protein PELOTA 1-like n=1 Tax=Argentina anserina TaxID=57926 RepID=UPI00217625D6|nr:protein PELOTA 1-like [Potentilla anserina]
MVKILPEDTDDVWFVYDLISRGDVIIATTTRNVKEYSSRVRLSLGISVTTVEYHKDCLCVHGTTLTSQYIKKGSFHTVYIEINKEFEIYREVWDKASVEKLLLGSKNVAGADLAVVLLQPTGFTQVFLVGLRQTKLCAKVESRSNPHKYFENIFRAFVKHVDLSVVRLKVKSVENNKQRIVVFNTRNKGKDGSIRLNEVLHDSIVMNLIKDTKAVMEIKAYKDFSDLLTTDLDRVCYGAKNVKMAHELKAIETLLITDDLYESVESATRYKSVEFVESVKKAGGKAFVFSSKHVSGEELANLTGIAAILRFPLPYLDEIVS